LVSGTLFDYRTGSLLSADDLGVPPDGPKHPSYEPSAHATATTMPNSLSEDSPFRAGVLPETQVLLAGQDLLTGLSSRAGLDAHYRLAAARARRSGARLAVGVVAIDVDPATPPDEVFGHDLLMVEAAKQLRTCLRETDLIARLGETRFAFVAEEVTTAGIPRIVARVARAVGRAPEGQSAPGRALVGMALWEGGEQSLAALLRAAEEALTAGPMTAGPVPSAANAESFGAQAERDVPSLPVSRSRRLVRRTLGWVSLATLVVLALSATPAHWRNRWLPVDGIAQQGWSELRARLPLGAPVADRRP
jgi:diguanylate cyclase (GGDEF)-like protein